MGMSSYYEGLPQGLVDAVNNDTEIASAIDCLWGQGNGMYAWFDELGEALIGEIADSGHVSQSAVRKLRDLLTRTVSVPGAYIEKTHDEHESMLRSAFAELGAPDAEELARVAIFGECDWGFGTQLAEVGRKRCLHLANYMRQIDVSKTVNDFDLASRTPVELWRESLMSELRELIACYCSAADEGNVVLTGVT